MESKILCRNCGKEGHKFKQCKVPITSYGIICLRYDHHSLSDIVSQSKGGEFVSSLKYHPKYNSWINDIENNLKLLMICRKDSISYIEFLRGHYVLDDKSYILILFNGMSLSEKNRIMQNLNNFEALWINLWSLDKNVKSKRNIEKEYLVARMKYTQVQNYYDIYNLIKESKGNYISPEWGFPKGRRSQNESDLECAQREFEEETTFKPSQYNILELKPLFETFTACNNETYKHIYYIAESNVDVSLIDTDYLPQCTEIGNIKWISYKNAIEIIRPYHESKKQIVSYLFNHLKNIIIQYHLSKLDTPNSTSL